MGPNSPVPLEPLRALLASVPERLGLGTLSALVAVASRPGLSVNDLAESLGVPQQTASRHVAALVGRARDGSPEGAVALIEQRISFEDPRRRALLLTAAGREVLECIVKAGWTSPPASPDQNPEVVA